MGRPALVYNSPLSAVCGGVMAPREITVLSLPALGLQSASSVLTTPPPGPWKHEHLAFSGNHPSKRQSEPMLHIH